MQTKAGPPSTPPVTQGADDGAAPVEEALAPPMDEIPPIVERPDGYYWQAPGLTEVGPFDTFALACASRDSVDDAVYEAPMGRSEVLQAERDLGINDWIDADTGAPAEGQSPPRLEGG